MMKNRKLKAVFFDFDNTLVDTMPVIIESIKKTLDYYKIEQANKDDVIKMSHLSARDYFPKIFGSLTDEAIAYYRKIYESLAENAKPLPGSIEVLETLTQNKIPIAVISNKTGDLLRKEISTKYKWDQYFELVIGSKDTEADKPSKVPALFAAKKLNLVIDQSIWFIGDAVADIECGINSGCLPILFGQNSLDIDSKYKPAIHLKNHSETLKLIKENL